MKAEKRKELHTNALRHSISRLVTRLKEKPGQFSYMVWGIVILVAGTVIAGIYFYNERKKANSARWEQLAEAMTAEDLNKIIKNNKDTPAARDARLKLARALWASGEPGLHDDTKKEGKAASEDARAKLAEAAKTFEELVGEYGDMPILVQECYFNAGKIHESLGNYDQALKNYHELAKKYPKSMLGKQAVELAENIDKNRPEMEATQKQFVPKNQFQPSGSGGG